jgi:hypothetical protein
MEICRTSEFTQYEVEMHSSSWTLTVRDRASNNNHTITDAGMQDKTLILLQMPFLCV